MKQNVEHHRTAQRALPAHGDMGATGCNTLVEWGVYCTEDTLRVRHSVTATVQTRKPAAARQEAAALHRRACGFRLRWVVKPTADARNVVGPTWVR